MERKRKRKKKEKNSQELCKKHLQLGLERAKEEEGGRKRRGWRERGVNKGRDREGKRKGEKEPGLSQEKIYMKHFH